MTDPSDSSSKVDLDVELDRLYRGPMTAFVAERNKLVQALRRAGDRDRAEQVAALPRPTPVAWAVNQLHFEAHACLEALRETGAALRDAQESAVDAEEFAARKRAQKEAHREATDECLGFAEGAGITATAALKRRIELTLGQLSAAETVAPPPGRMSAELEPAGFDALGAVAVSAPRPERKAAPPPDEAARLAKLAALQVALDAAAVEVRRLEREAELRDDTVRRTTRDAEEAERRANDARKAREDASAAAREARERLDAARALLAEASRALGGG